MTSDEDQQAWVSEGGAAAPGADEVPGSTASAGTADEARADAQVAAFGKALADHALGGLRWWPDAPPIERLEFEAARAEWACVTIDGSEDESAAEFLDTCAEAFAFPDWFGYNFDALEECLGDLEPEDFDGRIVLWANWAGFAEAEPARFRVALDVLRAAARGWRGRQGFGGAVLMLGEGPEAGLVELSLS